ncbi:hypothetical protein E2C01_038233 [Portunus trituberculatus]|uniref:Uncharacterized protein n=1 Tax=Portunus trituberculatus TaxID=210409 RepID=A0A5B7FGQ3_PORTR|nr:hypothetical protein [Portunus trituberculatus]
MHSIPGIQGVLKIDEVPVVNECQFIALTMICKPAIHCNSPGQPLSTISSPRLSLVFRLSNLSSSLNPEKSCLESSNIAEVGVNKHSSPLSILDLTILFLVPFLMLLTFLILPARRDSTKTFFLPLVNTLGKRYSWRLDIISERSAAWTSVWYYVCVCVFHQFS